MTATNFGTVRPRHHSTHKTARAVCCDSPKARDRSRYACDSSIKEYKDPLLTYLTLGKKRTTPDVRILRYIPTHNHETAHIA
ncbi:Uncharacterized protein LW93_13336 [Fusarium fujikuroi]|nr:Uncharacterized protein LW93_13336 [Fusarium fujikuroi]